jgi:hypothetical protein
MMRKRILNYNKWQVSILKFVKNLGKCSEEISIIFKILINSESIISKIKIYAMNKSLSFRGKSSKKKF